MAREAPIFVSPPLTQSVMDLLADSGGQDAHPSGVAAVMGSPRLSRRLARQGHRVVCVLPGSGTAGPAEPVSGPTAQQGRLWAVRARAEALPFASGSLHAVVAVSVLGGCPKDLPVSDVIRTWSRCVRPYGTLAIAEMAAEGWAGRLLLKLTRKIKGQVTGLGPARLCALLLEAGVRRIRQVWPQGVGSYVLTSGRVGPLCGMTAPVEGRM